MTPEEIGVLVGSIQENADRLGLTWVMRTAKVSAVDPLALVFDGDAVEAASEISNMVDGLALHDRVYVISVPPAGTYVIGRMALTIPKRSYGRGSTVIGILASSTGVEAAIPAASWVIEPKIHLGPGRIAKVTFCAPTFINQVLDSNYVVRLRIGSASITGTMLLHWHVDGSSQTTNVKAETLVGYVKNVSGTDSARTITASIQQVAGAAQAGFYSDVNNPLTLEFEDMDSVNVNTAFAAGLISI